MTLGGHIHLTLAWRNLWRHKRRTWLTVGAMVFCNGLLIFLLSLQLGMYELMISNTLNSFSGHMQIQHPEYFHKQEMRHSIVNSGALSQRLRQEFPEAHFSERALGFALLSSEQRSLGAQIIGVDPHREIHTSTIPGLITEGDYLSHPRGIVIGSTLAKNLKVEPGSELILIGSAKDGSIAADSLTVNGIFHSGIVDLDRHMAQMRLGDFQNTFFMPDQSHHIAINTRELDKAKLLQARATDSLSKAELQLLDWQTLHPGLKQAIQADMASAWLMYIVLIILVALGVLNTQLMSVLERTREFGTMLALGVQPASLSRLILLETLLLSLLGLLLGIALGTAIVETLSVTGFSYPGMDTMSQQFNLPSVFYPQVSTLGLLLGPGCIFAGCMTAALYPAIKVLQLQPLEAMRSRQ